MRSVTRVCCFLAICASLILIERGQAAQPFPLPVPRATNILPERVALSDLVVLGRVTAVADERVTASSFPRQTGFKIVFKVAAVEASEILLGPKDRDKVRVGFMPDPDLTVGQEACFLLMKHPEQGFYVPTVHQLYGCPPGSVFIDKSSTQQLGLIKRCAKLLSAPMAGLKAKDAEDRFLTAAMLIVRYRTYYGGGAWPAREPIDAVESKLILEALRDADWRKAYPETWPTPSAVFNHLGLPPTTYNPSNAGADPQTWLKENAATYRIERFAKKAP